MFAPKNFLFSGLLPRNLKELKILLYSSISIGIILYPYDIPKPNFAGRPNLINASLKISGSILVNIQTVDNDIIKSFNETINMAINTSLLPPINKVIILTVIFSVIKLKANNMTTNKLILL